MQTWGNGWRAGLVAGAVVAVMGGLSGAAWAADPAPALPGGASSVQETFDDWRVACVIQPAEADKPAAKRCALTQEQSDRSTGQRVLAMEVQPAGTAGQGALVLPFGLLLDGGVSAQVDDGAALPALRFRTCLPAGCVVPLSLDAKTLTALRGGKALRLKAKVDERRETQFAVSLKGFAQAFDRAQALAK